MAQRVKPQHCVPPAESPTMGEETLIQEQLIRRLVQAFTSLGLARNESYFDEAIKVVRQSLYGQYRVRLKSHGTPAKRLDVQVFKARLSKPIDKGLFAEKWKERCGGTGTRFRFKGTDLTVTQPLARTLWDADRDSEGVGFFDVLQSAVHDVARDCAILDCEEVTNVNS